jgi:hypothetical protein
MYTFKQAVKDSKAYIERADNMELFKALTNRDEAPKYREIILTVDDVYRLFYKRLLFKGALFKLHKDRKSLNDTILIPEVVACKIIPMLTMFAFCEHYTHPALESLREMILSMMDLITTYIDTQKVPKKNYLEIEQLKI